jgi:hypothetical protein
VYKPCAIEPTSSLGQSGQVQAQTLDRAVANIVCWYHQLSRPVRKLYPPSVEDVNPLTSSPTMESPSRYETSYKGSAIPLHGRWMVCLSLDATYPPKQLGDRGPATPPSSCHRWNPVWVPLWSHAIYSEIHNTN